MPPFRKHTDLLIEVAPPAGRRALEVGCGDGALLGWLGRRGAALAVGVDPDPAQAARAAATAGTLVARAVAERLPFPDRAFDLVLFFNSLHHVPVAEQATAVAEAARVLRPDGSLLVVEPVADGTWFELLRPLEDETAIRAHARETLRAAAPTAAGLRHVAEVAYASRVEVASLEAAIGRMLAANPERQRLVDDRRPELERLFAALAEPGRDGGFAFAQPMRLDHLVRAV